MSLRNHLIHHPRRIGLRRAFFQVHLWMGVLLSLYIAVIGASGSVLVFEEEFTRLALPPLASSFEPGHVAGVPAALAAVAAAHPQAKASYLAAPTPAMPFYRIRIVDSDRRQSLLTLDAKTVAILPVASRSWINWVHDLHLYLLLGPSGMQVNGVGAVVLLVLTATGLVLWWPGVRTWARGLRVNFRHNWRRINFDLHNAIGFWTLFIVVWWAISGVYFAWYKPVQRAVNLLSPLQGIRPPVALPASGAGGTADLSVILRAAQAEAPTGFLSEMGLPTQKGGLIHVDMDLRAPGDFSHRDILTFDPATGRMLSVWHYGQNHTLGDWFIWGMHPLHFGTLWGLPFKIIWALLGLSLPILSVTGLVMYWNRFLRKRWQALRR